ncbi:hypothetical protein COCSADRAFT_171054 [Bipolaris sorokiniana ND90Pr]|uniref:Uncharacterized protein n=1 Tax=Cochliobolus sativus (strain ND90Pr / ATCC 201652) TaxID=665912 RepID=M2REP8_COCSN|nr:uncharacterized protein COCSADRAFT_171054 [Bipolaris sorokiniana ND90Pr]EMD65249.1 hypothetical protein COCSADRAFT_171054 [Bipolaris sorokiniana ND90Pr]
MRIACLPGTPRLGNGKKPRRLSKFTGTSDGFKLFVSTTEKEEFTNDGSSQTSLHIMQHANLEEAPLLRPKTPISSQVLVTRIATVCMWVMAFQLLRDLLVSNQTHTSSTGESRRLISSGLGEEGHTMAEEISSSVPRHSQNATHAEEVSLRKGWAIIVPKGNGLITVEKLNAPVLPPATNRPADSNMHHFCLTTYILKPSTEPKLGYFNYCVGYLREGILYYGDTALGGQSMFSSEKRKIGSSINRIYMNFELLLRNH